jgi:GNAT superfamily N-acetyltransferase
MVQVRPARVDDAQVMADVYMRSWLAGYANLVDPEQLKPVAARRAAHDWPLTLIDPASRIGLGFVDGEPAGIAKVGPDPTEEVRGQWLDLLYVAPEFWGTGVATALLRWGVDQARATGARCVRLRVVAAQGRARRFYEREGWAYDGDVPPSHNDFFPLLCMRTDLA